MKMGQQQKHKQELDISNKATKKYDKVSTKIRKLLSATAQTFIPELCQALKDDWFPTMPEKDLQNNKGIRDTIRQKIIDDWSYSSAYKRSSDNIWSETTIQMHFPKYLRNPSDKLISNAARARDAKIMQKRIISEREKQKIEQIAEELPDEIIVPEEEPKSSLTEEDMHVLGVAPYGETGKSTMTLTGNISEHAYKLFAALTNNDIPPDETDDLLVDYIRPSREFRRGLMLEVDSRRRTAIHNALHFASVAIEDMIKIINEIDKQEEKK